LGTARRVAIAIRSRLTSRQVTLVPSTVEPLSRLTGRRKLVKLMETRPSIWRGVKKSEKLSLFVLAFCIVTLVAILVFHTF
jgi:hypothetical protein